MAFEVIVYNEQVRAKMKIGEHHRDLSDDWADAHYIEVKAADQSAAMRKMREIYPADKGFVIEGITEL